MIYYLNLIIRLVIPFIISYEILQKFLLNLTIKTSFYSLKVFSSDVFLIDEFLSFNETFVKFVPACAAASAFFLLLILTVLTKDINLEKRLKIFITGSLIIFIINILRIISLVIILDKFSINLFNTLHLFFWSIVASLLVAGVWIYLTKKYKVKSIPIYSDLKYLLKKINLYK